VKQFGRSEAGLDRWMTRERQCGGVQWLSMDRWIVRSPVIEGSAEVMEAENENVATRIDDCRASARGVRGCDRQRMLNRTAGLRPGRRVICSRITGKNSGSR
jgi:hypothetical protein